MENVIVYLIGPPGVGKCTVGSLLAQQIPAQLVDNHYWNNPIFQLIMTDGKTPLPESVWDLTDGVRRAVLETIATLSPPGRSFIFTHAVSHDGGHPMDRRIADQILSAAKRRRARTLVVSLSCDAAALAERIESPGRVARLKERNGARAAHYASLVPYVPKHDWTMQLDTTRLSPSEAADVVQKVLRSKAL